MLEDQKAKPKRKRMQPHERRMHLLDAARRIIELNGLASLTMDEVANEANVSLPLIYKYFDTRMQLLHELLIREYNRFDRDRWERLGGVKTFRQQVEIFIRVNFEEAERANTVDILRSQPDIRKAIENTEQVDLGKIDRFLVKGMMREFGLLPEKAAQFVATASGASKAAAQYRRRYGGNKNKMIKETLEFIFSGVEAVIED